MLVIVQCILLILVYRNLCLGMDQIVVPYPIFTCVKCNFSAIQRKEKNAVYSTEIKPHFEMLRFDNN